MCRRIVSTLLTALAVMTACARQSPTQRHIFDCSRVIVVSGRTSAMVLEHDDAGIHKRGMVLPPKGAEFSQASYDCQMKAVLATFNTYLESPWQVLSVRIRQYDNPAAESGLLVDADEGTRTLVPIDLTPYAFERHGKDLLVDTGRIVAPNREMMRNLTEQHGLAPADMFANILRIDPVDGAIKQRFPFGGGVMQMQVIADQLYVSGAAVRIDLSTGQADRVIAPRVPNGERDVAFRIAVTNGHRVFGVLPLDIEWYQGPYEEGHLYEFRDGWPTLVVADILPRPTHILSHDGDIYLVASDATGTSVARYRPGEDKVSRFKLPLRGVYKVASDGVRIILLTGQSSGRDHASSRPIIRNRLYVATPDFSRITETDVLPTGWASRISTATRYSRDD